MGMLKTGGKLFNAADTLLGGIHTGAMIIDDGLNAARIHSTVALHSSLPEKAVVKKSIVGMAEYTAMYDD